MALCKSGRCWGERLSPEKATFSAAVSSCLLGAGFKGMIIYENSSSSNISTLCSGKLWIYRQGES